jgi:hypothetical protein
LPVIEGVIVPCTNGAFALVSEEDADRVLQHVWTVCKTGKKYYVVGWVDGVNVRLHRFILGLGPDDPWVDHRSGLTMDCRRSNLRLCTPTENAQNAVVRKTNITGVKGVSYHKKNNRYHARIRVNGERISLGYFNTAEDAGIAYATAAQLHFGEFAYVYPNHAGLV